FRSRALRRYLALCIFATCLYHSTRCLLRRRRHFGPSPSTSEYWSSSTLKMPTASDLITYIGVPLTVLGMIPILYNFGKAIWIRYRLSRTIPWPLRQHYTLITDPASGTVTVVAPKDWEVNLWCPFTYIERSSDSTCCITKWRHRIFYGLIHGSMWRISRSLILWSRFLDRHMHPDWETDDPYLWNSTWGDPTHGPNKPLIPALESYPGNGVSLAQEIFFPLLRDTFYFPWMTFAMRCNLRLAPKDHVRFIVDSDWKIEAHPRMPLKWRSFVFLALGLGVNILKFDPERCFGLAEQFDPEIESHLESESYLESESHLGYGFDPVQKSTSILSFHGYETLRFYFSGDNWMFQLIPECAHSFSIRTALAWLNVMSLERAGSKVYRSVAQTPDPEGLLASSSASGSASSPTSHSASNPASPPASHSTSSPASCPASSTASRPASNPASSSASGSASSLPSTISSSSAFPPLNTIDRRLEFYAEHAEGISNPISAAIIWMFYRNHCRQSGDIFLPISQQLLEVREIELLHLKTLDDENRLESEITGLFNGPGGCEAPHCTQILAELRNVFESSSFVKLSQIFHLALKSSRNKIINHQEHASSACGNKCTAMTDARNEVQNINSAISSAWGYRSLESIASSMVTSESVEFGQLMSYPKAMELRRKFDPLQNDEAVEEQDIPGELRMMARVLLALSPWDEAPRAEWAMKADMASRLHQIQEKLEALDEDTHELLQLLDDTARMAEGGLYTAPRCSLIKDVLGHPNAPKTVYLI
ncbi:hypothetical protein IWZ01DRAFT_562619, partial [Phyllosticta capitalensis]